jgi:hypothetical protein
MSIQHKHPIGHRAAETSDRPAYYCQNSHASEFRWSTIVRQWSREMENSSKRVHQPKLELIRGSKGLRSRRWMKAQISSPDTRWPTPPHPSIYRIEFPSCLPLGFVHTLTATPMTGLDCTGLSEWSPRALSRKSSSYKSSISQIRAFFLFNESQKGLSSKKYYRQC